MRDQWRTFNSDQAANNSRMSTISSIGEASAFLPEEPYVRLERISVSKPAAKNSQKSSTAKTATKKPSPEKRLPTTTTVSETRKQSPAKPTPTLDSGRPRRKAAPVSRSWSDSHNISLRTKSPDVSTEQPEQPKKRGRPRKQRTSSRIEISSTEEVSRVEVSRSRRRPSPAKKAQQKPEKKNNVTPVQKQKKGGRPRKEKTPPPKRRPGRPRKTGTLIFILP